MGTPFPLVAYIGYIVEQRAAEQPNTVEFAWMFDTQEEAEEMLLQKIRKHGLTRFYTAYINIE